MSNLSFSGLLCSHEAPSIPSLTFLIPLVGCFQSSIFFTALSRQAVASALGLSLPSPAFPCYLRHAPEEVFLNANPIMSLSSLKITGGTSLPAPVMGKIGPRLNVVLVPPKKLESKSQKIKFLPSNLTDSQDIAQKYLKKKQIQDSTI